MKADLAGRVTPAGPVPRHLRPVFRDRAEFAAGSLQQQTVAALQSSQFLIVIASENSAKSDYVDAEIRQFKALHGEGRVLPLIVEGAPPQCFAPALREKIGPDGAALGAPADDVAGDIIKDGKPRALIKIVAGLTGLPFDDLWMRHVRETRKRACCRHRRRRVCCRGAGGGGVFLRAFRHQANRSKAQRRTPNRRQAHRTFRGAGDAAYRREPGAGA